MQDTSYSVGPKFFGTTAKSTFCFIKNLGLTKAIDAPLGLEHMTQDAPTCRTLPLGEPPKTQSGTLFSKNITVNILNPIAIRWSTPTKTMYLLINPACRSKILHSKIRGQREPKQDRRRERGRLQATTQCAKREVPSLLFRLLFLKRLLYKSSSSRLLSQPKAQPQKNFQ